MYKEKTASPGSLRGTSSQQLASKHRRQVINYKEMSSANNPVICKQIISLEHPYKSASLADTFISLFWNSEQKTHQTPLLTYRTTS